MQVTRELSAVIAMQKVAAQICEDWHESANAQTAVAIRALDPATFIKNDAVHVAKPLAESAVASQSNSAVPVDETAWLLEWHFHGSIHYFGMSDLFPDFDFSHLDKAMRFARVADAEQAKRWVERTDRKRLRGELRDLRIAEHMWPASDQSGASAPKTGVVPHEEKNGVSASHECGSVPDEQRVVAARLDALLPELMYSRETHVQWRDCEQICRDRNPQIGDAKFHAQAVLDYDERIAAITEAAALIRSGMQPPATVEQEAIAKPGSVHLAVQLDSPESRVEDPRTNHGAALLMIADLNRQLADERSHIQQLQKALMFWLPMVPDSPNDVSKRTGDDAMLLMGYEGEDEPSAEAMGWIALQSGISSPSFRPNEQNAVVQTEQPSLSDAQVWDIYVKANDSLPFGFGDRSGGREFAIALTKAILAQRQDSDKATSEQCVSMSGPTACYRVRCQLGKVCAAIANGSVMAKDR